MLIRVGGGMHFERFEDPWFVEVVIDTGQRLQSVVVDGAEAAAAIADDMAGRMRSIAVTMLQCATGECIVMPSANLMAGFGWIHSKWDRMLAARSALDAALAPVE